jgi:hypothetical protein
MNSYLNYGVEFRSYYHDDRGSYVLYGYDPDTGRVTNISEETVESFHWFTKRELVAMAFEYEGESFMFLGPGVHCSTWLNLRLAELGLIHSRNLAS